MAEVKGVLLRFAKRGEQKVTLTHFNGDYILWVVKNGVILRRDNYYHEAEEAETAYERARNDLLGPP